MPSPRFTGREPTVRIHNLIEGQTAVRLDYRHLPDLDDLMLTLAAEADDYQGGWRWTEDDEPTRFAAEPEPVWQWVKISPCWCGEHGWHWDSRRVPDDRDLLEDRPSGKFVAMEWMG